MPDAKVFNDLVQTYNSAVKKEGFHENTLTLAVKVTPER